MKDKLVHRLYDEICQIEIIDTHEHLVNREMLNALGFNALYAIEIEYLKDDLLALGMPENLILEKGADQQALLPELLPLLRQTENTTYYKALLQAFKDLHGLKGNRLDADALQSVSQSIAAAYDRENWYGHVVREKCNIKHMLRDMAYMTAEDDFVKPVIRMDSHLMLRHRNLLESWVNRAAPIYCPATPEAEYRETVCDLDDYLSLIEADFKRAIEFGAVAIKLGIAYERTLQFDKVSLDEANKAFKLPDEKTTWDDIKIFQDYIVYLIIQNAITRGLPVQIHTGILAGGKSMLANSNPLLLSNLFLEFPDARFDIFHGGFPFLREMGSLALMFPNVYLNTCWLPLISYASFQSALREWLCYVPAGKFLWGGDCHSVEGIYGSVFMMRQALSEVLAGAIEDGLLDKDAGLSFARGILRDNAGRLFGL
jgi:predicted TIM-barrel fold metal-dependent hydrolase